MSSQSVEGTYTLDIWVLVSQLNELQLPVNDWPTQTRDNCVNAIVRLIHIALRLGVADDDLSTSSFEAVNLIRFGPERVIGSEHCDLAKIILVLDYCIRDIVTDQSGAAEDQDILGCCRHCWSCRCFEFI